MGILRSSNRLLRCPGFICLASVDDTSRWHQRIFRRDYRPRKTRVPAVRSRCLLLPPAAAAPLLLGTWSFHALASSLLKLPVPAVKTGLLHPALRAVSRFSVNSRRSLRTRVVGLSQEKQTKEKADYRMVVCFSLAPPVGLEPTTLRLTAACSAD